MDIGRPDRSMAVRSRPDWFLGTVWQQRLTEAVGENGVSVLAVWFEAGSRTRPHVHGADQTLHVMEGTGLVATETEKRIIRTGDVVVVPAGTWHWHGALPDVDMMHLSIKEFGSVDDWDAPWLDFDRYAEGAE